MFDNITNRQWTVSELSNEIKNLLENKFFHIKVKGEITNYRGEKSKGSYYFSIKDKDNSSINVVMWKGFADLCKIEIKNGIEINVYGKLSTWKGASNYQIQAEKFELINNDGELLKIIEERKQKLLKEGLFDVSKKKPIPKFPKTIGLITAENSAAINDILSRLQNRTPIKIKLYSVLVQGKTASNEIIKAIKYFNNLKVRPDVLVITRGGGSIEDLMPFNDEELAREVFNSKIPTISAIGHEIDTPIIDYVSDCRLPTPTSVAEHITMSKEQAYKNLNDLINSLFKILINKNKKNIKYLKDLIKNIFKAKNQNYIKKFLSFDKIKLRLFNLIKLKIHNYKNRLINIKNLIKSIFKARNQNFTKKSLKFDKLKLKLSNLIKLRINNYKIKLINLRKININKTVKNLINNYKTKLNILSLKLKNYINKNPIIVKDLQGKQILLKSQINKNENYILKFLDGEITIKIIE